MAILLNPVKYCIHDHVVLATDVSLVGELGLGVRLHPCIADEVLQRSTNVWHSNAHSNAHTSFECAFAFECECKTFAFAFECECKTFAFAFECECKTFAFAFECHFKTFDGSNVLPNAFQMLGYMNIIASPNSQLMCW